MSKMSSKYMNIEQLIRLLQTIKNGDEKDNVIVRVACDEEWNTIFNKLDIVKNEDTGEYIIFGLSGTEQEQDF